MPPKDKDKPEDQDLKDWDSGLAYSVALTKGSDSDWEYPKSMKKGSLSVF